MKRAKIFSGWALALCGTLLAVWGCQTFEMEKVEPDAVGAKQKNVPVTGEIEPSYIMLVIDKSGSMLNTMDGSAKGCQANGDRTKACRWNALLDAFDKTPGGKLGFLHNAKTGEGKPLAYFGLASYPRDSACEPGGVDIPLDPTDANVAAIVSDLNSSKPVGGTPTAKTLLALLDDPVLATPQANRSRFVMLLTDGAPNCNTDASAVARCEACNAAQTAESCNDLTTSPIACYPVNTGAQYGLGHAPKCQTASLLGSDCLDLNATVEAIKKLRAAGIDTFVIGFGNTSSDEGTLKTLNEAAIAGGRPNANGGDGIHYYEATNTEELSRALEDILNSATDCSFELNPPPSDESSIQVVFRTIATGEDATLTRNVDWTYVPESRKVTVSDAYCNTIKNAQPDTYSVLFFYQTNL